MQSKRKREEKGEDGPHFLSFFSRSQPALSAACRSVFIFLFPPPCPQSLFSSKMARRRAEEVLELGTSLEGEGGPKKKVKRRIFSPSFLLGHFYSGRRQEGKECVFVGRMGGVARCPFPEEEEEEKGSGVFSSDVTTTPSYTSSSPRRGLLRRSCSSASNSVFYFPVCEEDMDRSVKKISRHISFKEV